jgi:E3 ubiquitin-protein ligase listerin
VCVCKALSTHESRTFLVFDKDAVAIPLLASYVYYRALKAVPSLVRLWWEGCKNRQLSMAVGAFTSRHFSPVLISQELEHLKGEDLSDENMTVKVSSAVNEVKAVYVVDDQPMEIGVRLPGDFPLQGVEVKDVRKVGVTDAQWRAWILNVQQVMCR